MKLRKFLEKYVVGSEDIRIQVSHFGLENETGPSYKLLVRG